MTITDERIREIAASVVAAGQVSWHMPAHESQ